MFFQQDNMGHIPVAIWWALVTMTTVGYGDFHPISTGGYIIGSLCTLSGIIIIAMPTPIIVQNFSRLYSTFKACQRLANRDMQQHHSQSELRQNSKLKLYAAKRSSSANCLKAQTHGGDDECLWEVELDQMNVNNHAGCSSCNSTVVNERAVDCGGLCDIEEEHAAEQVGDGGGQEESQQSRDLVGDGKDQEKAHQGTDLVANGRCQEMTHQGRYLMSNGRNEEEAHQDRDQVGANGKTHDRQMQKAEKDVVVVNLEDEQVKDVGKDIGGQSVSGEQTGEDMGRQESSDDGGVNDEDRKYNHGDAGEGIKDHDIEKDSLNGSEGVCEDAENEQHEDVNEGRDNGVNTTMTPVGI